MWLLFTFHYCLKNVRPFITYTQAVADSSMLALALSSNHCCAYCKYNLTKLLAWLFIEVLKSLCLQLSLLMEQFLNFSPLIHIMVMNWHWFIWTHERALPDLDVVCEFSDSLKPLEHKYCTAQWNPSCFMFSSFWILSNLLTHPLRSV